MAERIVVPLPDGENMVAGDVKEARLLYLLAGATPAHPVSIDRLTTALYGKGHKPDNVIAVMEKVRSLGPVLRLRGWPPYTEDEESIYLKPGPREDGFYPYVQVYNGDQLVDVDGRQILARTLDKSTYTVRFAAVLVQVQKGSKRKFYTIYPEVTAVVAESNRGAPRADWIISYVVKWLGDTSYFFLSKDKDRVTGLLIQHEPRLTFALKQFSTKTNFGAPRSVGDKRTTGKEGNQVDPEEVILTRGEIDAAVCHLLQISSTRQELRKVLREAGVWDPYPESNHLALLSRVKGMSGELYSATEDLESCLRSLYDKELLFAKAPLIVRQAIIASQTIEEAAGYFRLFLPLSEDDIGFLARIMHHEIVVPR